MPRVRDLRVANPHLATPLPNRRCVAPMRVPQYLGYSQVHVRLRSIWQYAHFPERGSNCSSLRERGRTRFREIYLQARMPSPRRRSGCRRARITTRRTCAHPRGLRHAGPCGSVPASRLSALRDAASRRRGERAGRGGRMGSFRSNKRMCDLPYVCWMLQVSLRPQGEAAGLASHFERLWS